MSLLRATCGLLGSVLLFVPCDGRDEPRVGKGRSSVASAPVTNAGQGERDDLLSIRRDYEDTQIFVALHGAHLQYFVLDGNNVTRWRERNLAPAEAAEYWKVVDRADLPGCWATPPKTRVAPGAHELIEEPDSLAFDLRRSGQWISLPSTARRGLPQAVRDLCDRLERGLSVKETPSQRPRAAWLADPLDGASKPGAAAMAEELARAGQRFDHADEAWWTQRPGARRAVESPGMLEADSSGQEWKYELPTYVEHAGTHARLRRLRIALVE